MIDPLEQEGLEEEGLNDNIIRINGRFFPNDRYPNPFDRLIAAVYARELDENIALTTSNIKQSKRESVNNKDGEIISEKLVYICFTDHGNNKGLFAEKCPFVIRATRKVNDNFCTVTEIVWEHNDHLRIVNDDATMPDVEVAAQRKNAPKLSSVLGNSTFLINLAPARGTNSHKVC